MALFSEDGALLSLDSALLSEDRALRGSLWSEQVRGSLWSEQGALASRVYETPW